MSSLFEVRAPSEESEGTRSQVLRWLKAIGERVGVGLAVDEREVVQCLDRATVVGLGKPAELVG